MRKKLRVAFFVFLALTFMAGTTLAGPIKIKYATDAAPDPFQGPAYAYGILFKQIVEGESGGKYEVVIYPSSQLGKERDRIDQLKRGLIQINDASLGGVSQIYPNSYLFFIPYLFKNYEVAREVIDNSSFMDEFKADFKKETDLTLLDVIEVGEFADLTNNKHPIKSPQDMKGLKFRGMDKGQIALVQAMGGSGIPIAWSEVYTSLQTGVVDGQMNPPAILIWGKIFEVQKYVTLTRHFYSNHFMLTNSKWFKSLPQEDQLLFMRAHKTAANAIRGLNEIKESLNLEELAKKGMEIYQPTPQEMSQFKELGQPAYIEWLSEKIDRAWIDKAITAAAEAEKRVSGRYYEAIEK